MWGHLTGNTCESCSKCLHWAMGTGSGWHSSFLHKALYTHNHTHIHTPNLSCIGRGWCCHAHGDLTYRCRGDTNQREKPYCVCACVHACVRVSVCVWLWQKLELEEEKKEEEEEGLQEFILCLACLRFMPHSLTTLYQREYWTGLFNYQGDEFS